MIKRNKSWQQRRRNGANNRKEFFKPTIRLNLEKISVEGLFECFMGQIRSIGAVRRKEELAARVLYDFMTIQLRRVTLQMSELTALLKAREGERATKLEMPRLIAYVLKKCRRKRTFTQLLQAQYLKPMLQELFNLIRFRIKVAIDGLYYRRVRFRMEEYCSKLKKILKEIEPRTRSMRSELERGHFEHMDETIFLAVREIFFCCAELMDDYVLAEAYKPENFRRFYSHPVQHELDTVEIYTIGFEYLLDECYKYVISRLRLRLHRILRYFYARHLWRTIQHPDRNWEMRSLFRLLAPWIWKCHKEYRLSHRILRLLYKQRKYLKFRAFPPLIKFCIQDIKPVYLRLSLYYRKYSRLLRRRRRRIKNIFNKLFNRFAAATVMGVLWIFQEYFTALELVTPFDRVFIGLMSRCLYQRRWPRFMWFRSRKTRIEGGPAEFIKLRRDRYRGWRRRMRRKYRRSVWPRLRRWFIVEHKKQIKKAWKQYKKGLWVDLRHRRWRKRLKSILFIGHKPDEAANRVVFRRIMRLQARFKKWVLRKRVIFKWQYYDTSTPEHEYRRMKRLQLLIMRTFYKHVVRTMKVYRFMRPEDYGMLRYKTVFNGWWEQTWWKLDHMSEFYFLEQYCRSIARLLEYQKCEHSYWYMIKIFFSRKRLSFDALTDREVLKFLDLYAKMWTNKVIFHRQNKYEVRWHCRVSEFRKLTLEELEKSTERSTKICELLEDYLCTRVSYRLIVQMIPMCTNCTKQDVLERGAFEEAVRRSVDRVVGVKNCYKMYKEELAKYVELSEDHLLDWLIEMGDGLELPEQNDWADVLAFRSQSDVVYNNPEKRARGDARMENMDTFWEGIRTFGRYWVYALRPDFFREHVYAKIFKKITELSYREKGVRPLMGPNIDTIFQVINMEAESMSRVSRFKACEVLKELRRAEQSLGCNNP